MTTAILAGMGLAYDEFDCLGKVFGDERSVAALRRRTDAGPHKNGTRPGGNAGLHVAIAIPNHPGAREVEREIMRSFEQHTGRRLATG